MSGIIILTTISLILGTILVICDKILNKKDLKSEIEDILPGYNCGACGYGSCYGMTEAITNDFEAYKKCKLIKNKEEIEKIIKEKLKG